MIPRAISVGNSLFWCTQDASEVAEIFKYFPKERDFVAFRSAYGVLIPTAENIRALALHYVDEILDFQPVGPFMLGGHCFGARVVFEIARELMRRGHDVPFLALVEPPIPTWGTLISRKIWRIFGHIHRLSHGPLHERVRYFKQRLHRILARIRGGVLERTSGNARALPTYLTIGRPLVYSWKVDRQFIHYNGRVTLFYGKHGPMGCYRFRLFNRAWRQIARGGFEVHMIPGDHYINRGPHAKLLVEAMQCCLRQQGLW
ncbi:MAG: thioesterase domain-containing protein, partial [Nitrososphaera sp.]